MGKKEEENQEGEGRSDSSGDPSVTGLGALLLEEREKKGLSLEDMEKKTRLRPHVLAAIEAEEWDKLPQPVFVRGFIRSYAKALGLERAKVAEFCNKVFPIEEGPPKHLVTSRTQRKRTFLYLILAFIVVGGLAYLLQGGQSSDRGTQFHAPEEPPLTEKKRTSPEVNGNQVASIQDEERGMEITQGSDKVSAPESSPTIGPENSVEAEKGEDLKETTIEEEKTAAVEVEGVPPAILVLKGEVYERTWIKICIDDEEAKEYIFQRGSQPQWQGKKGFRVILGNAAGMSFEFNGTEHADLGKVGQVVKLAFPENFVSRHCED
jgi:cytoskeleton protein RodZ